MDLRNVVQSVECNGGYQPRTPQPMDIYSSMVNLQSGKFLHYIILKVILWSLYKYKFVCLLSVDYFYYRLNLELWWNYKTKYKTECQTYTKTTQVLVWLTNFQLNFRKPVSMKFC